MPSKKIISAIIISFMIGGMMFSFIQYEFNIKPVQLKYEENINTINNIKKLVKTEDQIYSLKYGLNYLSTNWRYDPRYLPDETINRDFGLFHHEGVTNITLAIVWTVVETERGHYQDDVLNDIIRICKIAEQYNLSVTIDFHTLMHENSYTIPNWVEPKRFETILLDPETRQNWLNFLNHSVTQLKNVTNISSWEMMNEPAIAEWAVQVPITDFASLWRDMKNIIRSSSDRPVSIRFGADSIKTQFNYDPSITEVCDFISINYYEQYSNRTELADVIQHYPEKRVIISEFGAYTNDDATQGYEIMRMVEMFQELKIGEWNAFLWRADRSNGVPELPGIGFNLAKNSDGEPRIAFYFLKPRYDLSQLKNMLDWVATRTAK